MTNEPSPLKYMGTQSQETMNLAAARAPEAASSKVADAAGWAMAKAKDTLHSAADQVRARTAAAVASRTREDPLRAVLIAAGVGALLMAVLSAVAQSGVRKVKRTIRR